MKNFSRKKIDIFLIFAQNIDCGYTLEPPCRGGSNMYQKSMFCKGFSHFINKNNIVFSAKDSHILSTKNNSVFVIFMFELLPNC